MSDQIVDVATSLVAQENAESVADANSQNDTENSNENAQQEQFSFDGWNQLRILDSGVTHLFSLQKHVVAQNEDLEHLTPVIDYLLANEAGRNGLAKENIDTILVLRNTVVQVQPNTEAAIRTYSWPTIDTTLFDKLAFEIYSL
jgi:hypothetical protein